MGYHVLCQTLGRMDSVDYDQFHFSPFFIFLIAKDMPIRLLFLNLYL